MMLTHHFSLTGLREEKISIIIRMHLYIILYIYLYILFICYITVINCMIFFAQRQIYSFLYKKSIYY